MRRGKIRLLICFSIIFWLGAVSSHSFINPSDISSGAIDNAPYQADQSQNPDSPETLVADSEESHVYLSDPASYYYKTIDSIFSYHVIWLCPVNPLKNHDLFVYTDDGYSQMLNESMRGSGELDWVVYKLQGAIDVCYPRVYVYPGSAGTAMIEWDTALHCIQGETRSKILHVRDQIELYYFYMVSSKTYDLHLTVPPECDFDLYLYYLEEDIAANTEGYLLKSTTQENGTDEVLPNFTPTNTGYYVALLVWADGNGTYAFTYDLATPSSGDSGVWVWVAAGILGASGAVIGVIVYARREKAVPEISIPEKSKKRAN